MEAQQQIASPPRPVLAKTRIVVEAYTFRRQGWPYLRSAVIALAVTLFLSGAMVTGTHLVLTKVKPVTATAQARQLAARSRLDQGQTERVEVRDYLSRFEQLRARGFFGAEDRLAVLESIQAIQKSRGLGPISFALAPQQTVALDPSVLEAPLALHSSGLNLRLPLVHEMDLVHLLDDLTGRGFFSVRSCSVSRGRQSAASGQSEQLMADCALFWLSVAEPAAQDPAAPAAPGG